jgi:hypothetical protein
MSSSISPTQENGEFCEAVERAFAALPPSAPAGLRSLRSAAIRTALLNTTWGDRSAGRIRPSWEGLLDAARRSRDGGDRYEPVLADLERLCAARIAELVAPGQVLLKLARRGFGVRLP